MSRALFQILVIPFCRTSELKILYCIFKRNDETGGYWQFVAGGGEENELPLQSAKRELFEETGIIATKNLVKLKTESNIPVLEISSFSHLNSDIVIPEYCYAIEIESQTIKLSNEHSESRWVNFDQAMSLIKWDSNKKVLTELYDLLK